MKVAVIDIGTITTRLLIRSLDGDRITKRVFTRLGEDLSTTGRLSTASLERTRAALTDFRSQIDAAGVAKTLCVATSAARDATNTDELAALVTDTLGVELEVLSGEDEGRFAFSGATGTHGVSGRYATTIDIGGGSTEFVVGLVGGEAIDSFSTDMGASRFTTAYIVTDPPEPEDLSAALSVVELHVIDARRELANLAVVAEDGPVIGLGGTITTIAAIDLGLVEYDSSQVNGYVLSREAVEDTFRALATESSKDRAHNPGLEPERVDVIVGGLCVLVEIMRQLNISEIVVSELDLLDGVALGALR